MVNPSEEGGQIWAVIVSGCAWLKARELPAAASLPLRYVVACFSARSRSADSLDFPLRLIRPA